jgi:hypothetical protein
VFNDDIFADTFHGIELLSVAVLDKIDFAKGAFSNDVDHCEVLKSNSYFCGPSLEEHLRVRGSTAAFLQDLVQEKRSLT